MCENLFFVLPQFSGSYFHDFHFKLQKLQPGGKKKNMDKVYQIYF